MKSIKQAGWECMDNKMGGKWERQTDKGTENKSPIEADCPLPKKMLSLWLPAEVLISKE